MIIESIHVKNFRSIYDETLTCENLTALIGPNGTGKSSFLKAIDLFYNSNANYSIDDFYNKDIEKNIEITITFTNLTNEEKELYKKYFKDKRLTVKKVMRWPKARGSQLYHGKHLQNPDFDSFRNAKGASELNRSYNELRDGKYSELPDLRIKEERLKALENWEEENPDKCSLKEDGGQFFGFTEVGKTNLEQYTRFVYVPAVHKASDEASESGKSVFTQIMDLVVRTALSQKKEFIELEKTTQYNYKDLIEHEKGSLNDLKTEISDVLGIYAPNSSVEIDWEPSSINLPVPKANIELIEDGHRSSVERCGHGLQRAFIMSMFEELAKIRSELSKISEEETEESEINLPNFIICIEEPEIYQHPNRQRYLSNILLELAEGNIENEVNRQIIYTTHSPLFVDLERFEKIRKLDKILLEEGKPKVTRVNYTDFDEVVKVIEKSEGVEEGTYKAEGFKARIRAIMTPWMNEGFFADKVVLVEGVDDRAAIIGLSNELKSNSGGDFEGNGISVIPCMSKNNLHQPYAIFSKLNIPVYCIWDSDYKKYKRKDKKKRNEEIKKNHRLLRLCGYDTDDWPDKIANEFACFKNDLNDTLKNEIDDSIYNEIMDECCGYLDMKRKDALKRPKIIEHLIKNAREKGSSSETLETIIDKILNFRTP